MYAVIVFHLAVCIDSIFFLFSVFFVLCQADCFVSTLIFRPIMLIVPNHASTLI